SLDTSRNYPCKHTSIALVPSFYESSSSFRRTSTTSQLFQSLLELLFVHLHNFDFASIQKEFYDSFLEDGRLQFCKRGRMVQIVIDDLGFMVWLPFYLAIN